MSPSSNLRRKAAQNEGRDETIETYELQKVF